jgi:hypothetical protein
VIPRAEAVAVASPIPVAVGRGVLIELPDPRPRRFEIGAPVPVVAHALNRLVRLGGTAIERPARTP